MGPLTPVRWPLYRVLKVSLWTRIHAEKGLPTQKLKKFSMHLGRGQIMFTMAVSECPLRPPFFLIVG